MLLPPSLTVELRVERVAQTVAEEVEREHDERDDERRDDHAVGIGGQAVERVGRQRAQRRHRRVDAETEVGQKALGKDRVRDLQR